MRIVAFLILFYAINFCWSFQAVAKSNTLASAKTKAKNKILFQIKKQAINTLERDYGDEISWKSYRLPVIQDSLFSTKITNLDDGILVKMTFNEDRFWKSQQEKYNVLLHSKLLPAIANRNATTLINYWDELFLPLKSDIRLDIFTRISKTISFSINEIELNTLSSITIRDRKKALIEVELSSDSKEKLFYEISSEKSLFEKFVIPTNEIYEFNVDTKDMKKIVVKANWKIPRKIRYKDYLAKMINPEVSLVQTIPIQYIGRITINLKGTDSSKIKSILRKHGFEISSKQGKYSLVISAEKTSEIESQIMGFIVVHTWYLEIRDNNRNAVILEYFWEQETFSLTSLQDADSQGKKKGRTIFEEMVVSKIRDKWSR